jgi:hypothetical protein
VGNNYYPRQIMDSRIETFKRSGSSSRTGRDLMAEVLVTEEAESEEGGQD